jgi:hypothetical protein
MRADSQAEAIAQCARDAGLYAFLGDAISQSVVAEMLSEQEREPPEQAFMLVLSSEEDTSDSLVAPTYYGPSWEVEVAERISMIQMFVACLMQARFTSYSVNVYITEGYSDRFESVVTSVDDLGENVMAEIRKEIDVPSLCLRIDDCRRTN